MRSKVQLPSPVTGENRTGATLEVGDQCLFHGERTVAMSTGQASGQHITFRNELEGILFRGLMFTFQMNPQGLTTNCFLTQGAFILLQRWMRRFLNRSLEHLLDRFLTSGFPSVLTGPVMTGPCSMIMIEVLVKSCRGQESHVTLRALV